MKKLLLLLPLLLFLPTVKAVTYISDCSVLDTEGETYVLTSDITDSDAYICMDIRVNNVVLDCQGHTIDGVDAEFTWGILIFSETQEISNITVRNCISTDWYFGIDSFQAFNVKIINSIANSNYVGIELLNSSFSRIINCSASQNSEGISVVLRSYYNSIINSTANSNEYGITILAPIVNHNQVINCVANENTKSGISIFATEGDYPLLNNSIINSTANSNTWGIATSYSWGGIIENNTAENNDIGFHIYFESDYNNISNNIIKNNDIGFYLFGSHNFIFNNIIKDNSDYGIYVRSSWNNTIYNNLFNNINNFYFYGEEWRIYTNYWNITKQSGTNIWNASLGYIGGNLWTTPSNNGFSDICNDTDRDGFCDEPYTLATGIIGGEPTYNIDYLPIAKQVGQGAPPTPPTPPPPPSVCQLCDPASLGVFGIICMIVNLFFCNPILIIILIFLVIVYNLTVRKA